MGDALTCGCRLLLSCMCVGARAAWAERCWYIGRGGVSELDGVRDSLCKDSVVGPGLCTELAGAGGLEFWSSARSL